MYMVFEGVTRTSPIPDGHASVSPRGSIAIGEDLGRDELKKHYAEFAYDEIVAAETPTKEPKAEKKPKGRKAKGGACVDA